MTREMDYKVDYHIHTTYSDGAYEPVDVVKKFQELGYSVIAITDHDGTGGLEEARVAGKALGINVVPGIELSSRYDIGGRSAELHILGYNIDTGNEELAETCRLLRQYRKDRNERFIAKMKERGIEITDEDLPVKHGGYVGKPDLVKIIRLKAPDIEDPFALFDDVPKQMIPAGEAVRVIRAAGGLPVLAHPHKTRELHPEEPGFRDRIEPVIADLKKQGLSGIECFHPSATHEQALELVELAEKYHLNMTTGSDFHDDEHFDEDRRYR